MIRFTAAFLILFFALIHPASAATDVKNDASLSTSLVSYWELEEIQTGSGVTRVDSHGTNDLTDNNTVGDATGIEGTGADIELSNSEHLSITDASQTGLDLSGDFTIQTWVKFESLPSNGAGMGIITKDTLTTANAYFMSVFTSGGVVYAYNQVNRTTTDLVQNFAAWNPSTGVWYHLLLVYDASAGNLKFYVDNSLLANNTDGTVTSIQNNSLPFSIGSHDGKRFFDGVIDEVAVWSKVLSSTERADLYNSGSAIPYDAGGGGGGGGSPARRIIPVTFHAPIPSPYYPHWAKVAV